MLLGGDLCCAAAHLAVSALWGCLIRVRCWTLREVEHRLLASAAAGPGMDTPLMLQAPGEGCLRAQPHWRAAERGLLHCVFRELSHQLDSASLLCWVTCCPCAVLVW